MLNYEDRGYFFMLKKIVNQQNILLLCGGILLFFFQNCGRAGFDEGVSDGGLSGLITGDTSFESRVGKGVFPFEANLNQISYMTCPMAGETPKNESSSINFAFYNVRAGAFDNQNFSGLGAGAGLTAADVRLRLTAGIRLKPSFFTDVVNTFKRNDATIMREALNARLEAQSYFPSLSLVNQDRSNTEGQFGWDNKLVRPLLTDLNSEEVLSSVLAAPQLGSFYSREPIGFLPSLDFSQRGILGSLSWGKSEADQTDFLRAMRTDLMLVLGYSKDPIIEINDLIDGTGSSGETAKHLMGRGYRLNFARTPASGIFSTSAGEAQFVTSIEEFDLAAKPPINVTARDQQGWDCFSMIMVRHIDRIDPMDPYGRPYCYDNGTTCITGARDATIPDPTDSTRNVTLNGVRYVCPPQSLSQLQNDSVAMKRLQIARRFLPANFFEINTRHMCVVASDAALSSGKCYSSGDKAVDKFIQYDQIQQTVAGDKPCGPGANECPAYVSICYRTR